MGARDDRRIGERFGRYRIVELIDRGGMGSVYRAHDERLDREVALKILTAVAEADQRERATREARAAASLDHPHVVAIYDVGEVVDEGVETPYLAMELVRGESLRTVIGRPNPPPLGRRVRWIREVADALAFAHARGVIHRDVKPENVVIREDGSVKVLDFGIARRHKTDLASAALPTLTEKGTVLGTPRYMAPEQMLGEDLDGRADEFAWGVLAYEVLAGRPPWGGTSNSLQAVAEMLLHPHVPLHEAAPSVPEEVVAVVERAMQRARRDRYASMTEIVAALDAWLSEPERDAKTAGGARAPAGRGQLPWAVAAGVALAAGLALTFAARAPTAPRPAPSAAPPPCSARACTTRLGAAAVCDAQGACAALASTDCRVASEEREVGDDRTVWMGAMYPLSGPDADSFGMREVRAVELARREIAGVLSAAVVGDGRRNVGLVVCDDAVDPARAAQHLVDVGVPAVVGFRTSQEAIDLASSTFLPHDVLVLSALNTSPLLTQVPQPPGRPRLVWRTAIPSTQTAIAAAALVEDPLEPSVRAHGLGDRAPMRVALVRQDDSAGRGFAEVFFRALRFNGRPALDNEASYQEIVVSLSSPAAEESGLTQAAARTSAFAPQVIVVFGADETFARFFADVERRWPAGALRPRYLKPAFLGPAIAAAVGRDAERRRRVLGLTARSSSVANARFITRYNAAFDDHVTRTFAPNSSYDALYVLAYATYAAPPGAVTGSALARGMARLVPPGRRVEVGPEGIFTALAALEGGESVDLEGATGPLDFDPATGDARVDLSVLCLGVDARGLATDGVESGAYFDGPSGRIRGTVACP